MCSVLESLDREYRRDEDWCSTDKAAATEDKVAYIQQLINKHQEQKEAFLKVHFWIIITGTHFFVGYCRFRMACSDLISGDCIGF